MSTPDVDRILEAITGAPGTRGRQIVAIAGPPAAGKSTLAADLVSQLSPHAALLGLDSFHFDDAVLNERGHRARKGAPHTFDVAGYRAMLGRIRQETATPIAIPVFDRANELSRAAAATIQPHHTIVITEGNWLLLDEPPWAELRPLFDLTVMLQAPDALIARRIHQRWTGLGLSPAEAERRAEENDLPNARHVAAASTDADIVLQQS